jgi:high-affinity Fe2+/Pb2+ permease
MINLTFEEIYQTCILAFACAGLLSVGFVVWLAVWTWRAEKSGFYGYKDND